MAWSWHDADESVDLTDLGGTGFPTQADAEVWLTEVYEDLAAAGVAAVTLYEEGRLVYGPMPLSP